MNGKYQRPVLKLSGESLTTKGKLGYDQVELGRIAREIELARYHAATFCVVVGAGNIVRGRRLVEETQIDEVTADDMGMLATVMNGLALRNVLMCAGIPAVVMSAFAIEGKCERFERMRALEYLRQKKVVVCVGGTGNPFFTTDTCAALRAGEIDADVLLKATTVDGIYDKDPKKHDDVVRYTRLTFDEAIEQRLRVADLAAFDLCQRNNTPIVVFDLYQPGAMAAILRGEPVGTYVGKVGQEEPALV